MRTIKFRGKSIETNEWVHGFYYEVPAPLKCVGKREESKGYIIKERPNSVNDWGMLIPMVAIEVDRKTVGQYIGINDLENKEIYEDDIVTYSVKGSKKINKTVMTFNEEHGAYLFGIYEGVKMPCGKKTRMNKYTRKSVNNVKVIGNIYDNPELEDWN